MADVFERRESLDPHRERLWKVIELTPDLIWLLLTKRTEQMPIMAPWKKQWPPNVWAGTTVESQKWADLRIPRLIQVPAPVRFLSVEPLLGPVTIAPWKDQVDWAIVGCESGPHARPMNLDWVRALRDECKEAGIAFFFKQAMEKGKLVGLPGLDGEVWNEIPKGKSRVLLEA
jgi:protein gp37